MINRAHLERWPLCSVCRREGRQTPATTTLDTLCAGPVSLCAACSGRVLPYTLERCDRFFPLDPYSPQFPGEEFVDRLVALERLRELEAAPRDDPHDLKRPRK